jgi:outer membrane lipoprotein SlyB
MSGARSFSGGDDNEIWRGAFFLDSARKILNRYIRLQLKRFSAFPHAFGQVLCSYPFNENDQGINVKNAFIFSSVRNGLIAGAVSLAALSSPLGVQAAPHHEQHCDSCGTVISSHTYERAAEHGSGLGIAGGALVGGLLGNRVGGGNGRKLATVAGAVGGGYAGNEIERNARSKTVTEVRVRMNNGAVHTFTEEGARSHYKGEHVRVEHGALVPQR